MVVLPPAGKHVSKGVGSSLTEEFDAIQFHLELSQRGRVTVIRTARRRANAQLAAKKVTRLVYGSHSVKDDAESKIGIWRLCVLKGAQRITASLTKG